MAPTGEVLTRVRKRSAFTPDRNPSDDRTPRHTVAPNRWLGECDSLIGPFASRRAAEWFANAMVDFGQYECLRETIVVHAGLYYVQACGMQEAPVRVC